MLGTLLAEQDQIPAALVALRQAANFNPTDLRVRKDLAARLVQSGQLDEAAEQLHAGLDAQPDNVAFLGMLASSNRC